jgi:hypothetical protein
MFQAYWMPASLRLVHSLEILADELVYSAVLVALFVGAITSKEKNINQPYLRIDNHVTSS